MSTLAPPNGRGVAIERRVIVPMMASRFNGVKVFSATMFADRDRLGETVTAWIAARPKLKIGEIVVTQSSDASFHCIAITVFYWEENTASRPSVR